MQVFRLHVVIVLHVFIAEWEQTEVKRMWFYDNGFAIENF